jgi:hypothetical protein
MTPISRTDLSRFTAMLFQVSCTLIVSLFQVSRTDCLTSKMCLIVLSLSTIKVMKFPHDLLLMGLPFCRIVARNL